MEKGLYLLSCSLAGYLQRWAFSHSHVQSGAAGGWADLCPATMRFGGHMSKSLRQFLSRTSLGLLGTAAAGPSKAQKPAELPPGAPPAFGTAPAVGPEVSPSTFAEAEKLMQVELSGTERAVAAGSWRTTMAALYERRTGDLHERGRPRVCLPLLRRSPVRHARDRHDGRRSADQPPRRARRRPDGSPPRRPHHANLDAVTRY